MKGNERSWGSEETYLCQVEPHGVVRSLRIPFALPGARALEKNGFMAAISSLAGKIVFETFPEPLRSKELKG